MIKFYDSGLQAYREPEHVRRYDPVDAAYMDVESGKVQKEGVWEEVWPVRPKKLYLYNRGDECTEVTGGWEKFYGSNASSHGIYAIITSKETDCLKLDSNSSFSVWSNEGFRTTKKINIDGYSFLKAKITIDRPGHTSDASTHICLTSRETYTGEWLAEEGYYTDVIEYTMSADITEVTEREAYIVCYMHSGVKAGANHYIFEIWLE